MYKPSSPMNKIRFYLLLLLPVALSLDGCKKPDFAAQQQAAATQSYIGEYIQNNLNFTILSAALQKTGLLDSLNNPNGTYTIFAPDDAAFAADSILSAADLDKFSVDSLRFFIRNHIMETRLFYSGIPITLDNLYTNANGLTLYISQSPNGASLAVCGAFVETLPIATSITPTYDLALGNGVIHVLDQQPIKFYSGTVQDFLANRPELSLFAQGVKKFNLWDSLATASPYTIFAPANQAFTANNITKDTIAAMDTSKLQSILFGSYIAYPHHIFLSDIGMVTGVPIPLEGGYQISFGYNGSSLLTAPDGSVLGPLKNQPPGNQGVNPLYPGDIDYLCTNGIVHILGQLMVLPSDVPK
jgi:uncharacterized surface protein with fasciclin (FAS1) repeats